MSGNNIFGPGHYVTTNEVLTRPTPIATSKNDSWFKQCDASGLNGTKVDEMWLNHQVASQRNLVRSAGATEGELLDDMLSEAASRYASGAIWASVGGTANALLLSITGTFVAAKSRFHGMQCVFIPVLTNTAAATANIFGLGVKKILRSNGDPLEPGDLRAGRPCATIYSATADAGAGAHLIMPWALAAASGIQGYKVTTFNSSSATSSDDVNWTSTSLNINYSPIRSDTILMLLCSAACRTGTITGSQNNRKMSGRIFEDTDTGGFTATWKQQLIGADLIGNSSVEARHYGHYGFTGLVVNRGAGLNHTYNFDILAVSVNVQAVYENGNMGIMELVGDIEGIW